MMDNAPVMDSADFLALASRILVSMIFLASAFAKITNFEGSVAYITSHGVPMASTVCVASVIVEVLGGLCLVLGFHIRYGALTLFAYLVPVTIIFHSIPDQRVQLLKNLAIMGGLLQIAAFGPGVISLDRNTQQ